MTHSIDYRLNPNLGCQLEASHHQVPKDPQLQCTYTICFAAYEDEICKISVLELASLGR